MENISALAPLAVGGADAVGTGVTTTDDEDVVFVLIEGHAESFQRRGDEQ